MRNMVRLSRAIPLSVFQQPLHSTLIQFGPVSDSEFFLHVGAVGVDCVDNKKLKIKEVIRSETYKED